MGTIGLLPYFPFVLDFILAQQKCASREPVQDTSAPNMTSIFVAKVKPCIRIGISPQRRASIME
jgi:hypothetical protein